jgi:hypothetical protein
MQRGQIVLRGATAEVAGRIEELESAYLSDTPGQPAGV